MRLTILIMFMLSPFLYSTDFKSINEVIDFINYDKLKFMSKSIKIKFWNTKVQKNVVHQSLHQFLRFMVHLMVSVR